MAEEGGEVLSFKSGDSTVLVYHSDLAGTNKATSAIWLVGDKVDEITKTLKARDVNFQHYDMPGMKLEGDVHMSGDMRVAWFKDPDGNVISLFSG